MKEFTKHKRTNLAELTPYTSEEDLLGISISDVDKKAGFEGGWIARNPKNHEDKWFVSKEYYADNFASAEDKDQPEPKPTSKTLHNSNASGASINVKDIVFWGNGDSMQLIFKASSQSEGWMKSTKAMDVNHGCIVQVTTQQRNPNGSYAVAEALTFVPGVMIGETLDDEGIVVGRFIKPI